MFFDPIKKAIANVHSGWKGTLQRISVETVEKMQKEYGSNSKDIICCICPSIRKCHFEVEKDVQTLFENEFKDLKLDEIIERKSENKWLIDTVKINEEILQKAGLRKENIIDCGICSVCNSDLIHSYRVEKEKYGLSTAIIGLK
jgi:YfiH family protein